MLLKYWNIFLLISLPSLSSWPSIPSCVANSGLLSSLQLKNSSNRSSAVWPGSNAGLLLGDCHGYRVIRVIRVHKVQNYLTKYRVLRNNFTYFSPKMFYNIFLLALNPWLKAIKEIIININNIQLVLLELKTEL